MKINNEFTAQFPVENFEEWVKESGVSDGMILSHQTVLVNNVTFDSINRYVNVEGILEANLDS